MALRAIGSVLRKGRRGDGVTDARGGRVEEKTEMEGCGHKPRRVGSRQKLEEVGKGLPQKLQRELVC